MSLHVHDIERSLSREIPLAVGHTLQDRASYAQGEPLALLADEHGANSRLVCYDYNNQVAFTSRRHSTT